MMDGECMLGLGDLGINGMPIPIGKLSLSSTCGELHPSKQMPVLIDVGTNNQQCCKIPIIWTMTALQTWTHI